MCKVSKKSSLSKKVKQFRMTRPFQLIIALVLSGKCRHSLFCSQLCMQDHGEMAFPCPKIQISHITIDLATPFTNDWEVFTVQFSVWCHLIPSFH